MNPNEQMAPMIRRRLRKLLPDVDKLRAHKALGVFGEHLFHPALWHLNRRSVAGGFAAGLFCGLIPGPLQMGGAALVALWLRVNLPVALATTLYTNPWDASVTGGYQRFPDDGSRIVVNFVSATEETDAINLHNP